MTDVSRETQDKFFLRSKTIIGGLIAALPSIITAISSLLGIDLPQAELETIGADIMTVLDSLNEIIGLAFVVVGRMEAQARIKWLPDRFKSTP